MAIFKEITSKDNAEIKRIVKLQSSARERRDTGLFVAEGLRVCDDCADNGIEIVMLVLSKNYYEKQGKSLNKYIEKAAETLLVSESVFSKIADTKTPQGILAVGKIPQATAKKINNGGRYVALENIADPSNLGAIARTAEAIGVDGIIVSADGCDPYSPKVIRASMGTVLRLDIIVSDNIVDDLKNSGLRLYGCVVKGGKDIRDVVFQNGSAVVIGNEANGLTEDVKKISQNITIPMQGFAESLNAAAAAAIAMWELKR
ncbi:MAG: RNA methyltransferase [Clostridia bacterium]|nr:RNA methyltransferase [Clostridia bacterium]